MWKLLYDQLVQLLTIGHAQYVQRYETAGRGVRNMLYTSTYLNAGVVLVATSLTVCVLYYYYFNMRFGRYYSSASWFRFAIINMVLTAVVTFLIVHNDLGKMSIPVKGYYFSLTLINIVYSIILFFIISMLIKWKSPMGKRSPI